MCYKKTIFEHNVRYINITKLFFCMTSTNKSNYVLIVSSDTLKFCTCRMRFGFWAPVGRSRRSFLRTRTSGRSRWLGPAFNGIQRRKENCADGKASARQALLVGSRRRWGHGFHRYGDTTAAVLQIMYLILFALD